MPKVAPKGTKHRPSSAPLLPAVPHRPAAALRRTRRRRSTLRAAVWPQSCTAVASQSRRRACDIALRRHACASPTLSMRALPARTPCERHLNPSSEPARGSLLPPPPPPARGAAAPSSLVVPVISPVIAGRSRRPIHFPQSMASTKILSRSIVSMSILALDEQEIPSPPSRLLGVKRQKSAPCSHHRDRRPAPMRLERLPSTGRQEVEFDEWRWRSEK